MSTTSIPELIADLKAGRMVILVDEEDRENEGDLVLAAEFVTPEAINFMAKHARGLICLTLTEERCRQLALPPMVSANRSRHGTNFTVSIEAAEGVTTGISAADRARTVRGRGRGDASPTTSCSPGHIFPVIAQPGGVLVRAGHTEAGCDLARLAGLTPAAVICEIMKDDGTMARLPDLIEFAARARAEDRHHRRPDPVSQPQRALVERVAEPAIEHRARRRSGWSPTATSRRTRRIWRWCAGTIDPERETLVRVHEPLSVLDLLDADDSTHSWPMPRRARGDRRARARRAWCC